MFAGALLARKFGFSWPEAIFIGTILTATSVTITAQTLMNLGQLRSKAGSTVLGAAVIDDVLGLVVLSLVVAINPAQHPPGRLMELFGHRRCKNAGLPNHHVLVWAPGHPLDSEGRG